MHRRLRTALARIALPDAGTAAAALTASLAL